MRVLGASFIRCKLDAEMRSADLRKTKVLALQPDCRIDFSGSRAQGMRMESAMTDYELHRTAWSRCDGSR